jgi:hypothetical protein
MQHDHETTSHPTRPRLGWVTPDCEQIKVSAEASAYAGARSEWDDD